MDTDEQQHISLEVTAAIVLQNGRLLTATRKPGSYQEGRWEFPGGKVRPGETLFQGIRREMAEELAMDITQAAEVACVVHHYPEKTVRLHFMACLGNPSVPPVAQEGQLFRWVTFRELAELNFAPADQAFIDGVRAHGLQASGQCADDRLMSHFQSWLAGGTAGDFVPTLPLPPWMHVPFGVEALRGAVPEVLQEKALHTVCASAHCPNLGECWSCGTATFLALGNVCTRNCRFCAVTHGGKPLPPDEAEPLRIAGAVRALKLRHAVITCVTRDDLADGGAAHLAATVRAIRGQNPQTSVEILVSDHGGNRQALDTLLRAPIRVFAHNLETVERLTPRIRSGATYQRSLEVLKYAADNAPEGVIIKSGMMLGLGETDDEVRQALKDMRAVGVTKVTLGQYSRPSLEHWPVQRYVTPAEFSAWQAYAEDELGYRQAVCGPLVRSSYHAGDSR